MDISLGEREGTIYENQVIRGQLDLGVRSLVLRFGRLEMELCLEFRELFNLFLRWRLVNFQNFVLGVVLWLKLSYGQYELIVYFDYSLEI